MFVWTDEDPSDGVPEDEDSSPDEPGDENLPNVGSITDDTKVYRCRRLSLIFRKRMVVAAAVVVAVLAAVAAPVAATVGRSGGTAASDATTSTSGPAVAAISVSTTVAASLDAVSRAMELKANELGRIPVLMYHKIGDDVVPPSRLRDDVARLKAAGFYPTTVKEMASGNMDIPAGKSPVVLSFDDSSPTHYKILADGTMDPDCAVAILLQEAKSGDWDSKATFFPLLYLESKANILFGQPEYAQKKLKDMVGWGFEIGSHTVDHLNLAQASVGKIKQELAESQSELDELIGGGYHVESLSPPYGEYPDDVTLLSQGEYEGITYRYEAAVLAGGGYAYSPFSTKFDRMRIPRVSAYRSSTVPDLVWYFRTNPEMRYVSDGDPDVLSAPGGLVDKLGTFDTRLGKQIVWY